VPLLNAYGLTETSDDTNHELLRAAPTGDRVPLGRAVRNVTVYVLDEQLQPVPLGAPGEICFSGVCVGRGYINDPERTAASFGADPYRPGERFYRSGDHGRWRSDGKLEFLGRRDNQVKIAGFRIEIGDVENNLLKLAEVTDAAVVVAGSTESSRHLVAFYAGPPAPLPTAEIRTHLAEHLPAYMIPRAFHHLEHLPLTANGKIDRGKLAAPADTAPDGPDTVEAPRTATEVRIVQAFAAVLGTAVESVRREDNFFDIGGTSLTGVKLVIALGRTLSLKQITRHPTPAQMAALIDASAAAA
jgi:acyl-coenzyme A synthetase/AMP-(fatty) acid ligase